MPEGYGLYREKLRHYRRERLALAADDKVLTGWNGLLLMALARAGRVFDSGRYLDAARELAAFLRRELSAGGRTLACFCGGEARFPASLDDCAFRALGLLELYDACFDPTYLLEAEALAEEILAHYADGAGGFFLTADDAEKLIVRPKELYDGALPSGNSAAAVLLQRLRRLTAKERWREAAEKQLAFLCANLAGYPAAGAFGLTALLDLRFPTRELVCAAPDEETPEALRAVLGRWAPELAVLLKTPARAAALALAAPFTADLEPKDGKAAFYLCEGGACRLPAETL